MNQHNQDKIKETLLKLLHNKKTNSKDSNKLIQKTCNWFRKEKLCFELRQELHYNTKLNETYKQYINQAIEMRNYIIDSRKELHKVCDQIKHDYKEFITIIQKNDKEIGKIISMRELNEKKYKETIIIKNKEKNELANVLNDITQKNQNNKVCLNKLKSQIEELNGYKDQLLNDYDKQQTNMINKIKILENRTNKYDQGLIVDNETNKKHIELQNQISEKKHFSNNLDMYYYKLTHLAY